MNSPPKNLRYGVKFTQAGRFFTRAAFTLPELLVMIVVIILALVVIIPGVAKSRAKARRIWCVNHLANVGLAHRIFATDNQDLFPWQTNLHKWQGLPDQEKIIHFYRNLSNELSTPRILVCRSDTRQAATSWADLTTNNVSYFLGISAAETYPQSFLAGDRNLTINGNRRSGMVEISSGDTIAWDETMHKFQGNAVMGDGSVQQLSAARAREQLKNTGLNTNTFLIP